MNHCPDCLFMKLSAKPISSARSLQWRKVIKQIQLNLTLNFNEQWETLTVGRIKFGIRGGELRLTVDNGRISDSDRVLKDNTLCLSLPIKSQKTVVDKTGKTDTELGSKNNRKNQDQGKYSLLQTTVKGTQESPVWLFQEKTGEKVLRGTIQDQKLAIVTVEGKPCLIDAIFKITEHDVYICDGEGLWSPDLNCNKLAIVEKHLIRYLFNAKLKPYLSRQKLRYE